MTITEGFYSVLLSLTQTLCSACWLSLLRQLQPRPDRSSEPRGRSSEPHGRSSEPRARRSGHGAQSSGHGAQSSGLAVGLKAAVQGSGVPTGGLRAAFRPGTSELRSGREPQSGVPVVRGPRSGVPVVRGPRSGVPVVRGPRSSETVLPPDIVLL
ncbi:unnamed protein product [Arctogadus glacialis]